MKKILVLAAAGFLTLTACKKAESGNKNVLVEENTSTEISNNNGVSDTVTTSSTETVVDGNKSGSNSYTYKGTDGTRAKVIFENSDKSSTLTIQANSNKFQLDKKADGQYERNGIKATVKGDSITLDQDNNVIDLVRDK